MRRIAELLPPAQRGVYGDPPAAIEPTTEPPRRGRTGPHAIIGRMGTVQEVRIAKRTGFCYGVREAIDKAKESAAAGKSTHTLGQVVHNDGVVRELQDLGIETVETLDDVDHGAAVVIRAHGVRPDVLDRAEASGLEVIDGTCTWVIAEQKELRKLVDEGYTIVLLGHAEPPRGGRAARVRAGRHRGRRGRGVGRGHPAPQEARPDQPVDPAALEVRDASRRSWSARSHELKIINTVCPVTIRRQEDTVELAREVDLMVVVGRPLEREHEGADAALRDRRQARGPDPGRRGPVRCDRFRRARRSWGSPAARPPRSRTCATSRLDPAPTPAPPRQRQRRDPRRRRARRRRDTGRPHDLAAQPVARRQHLRRSLTRWPGNASGLPVVAIVGRPNVGKSTLFNRIVGGRTAIVEDRARTTRDRLYGDAEWNGRRFVLVDTGGLELDPDDPIEARVQDQARLAIAEADVIVFVVDAVAGTDPARRGGRRHPPPRQGAGHRRGQQGRQREARARGAEFHALGWDETYAISATHGRGTGDLLDAIVWALPPESETGARAQDARGRGGDLGRRGRGRTARAVRRRRRRADDDRRRRGRARHRPRGDRPGGGPLGRRDGRRVRRRARGDRVRRSPERRQVEPAQRAPRRGAIDRVRDPRHDPRRHRHPARLGPERGRPHRHGRDPPPRQGRVRRRPRSAIRRCAPCAPCHGRMSRCSSSMPSRA